MAGNDAERFLGALFRDVDDALRFYVWTLPAKLTTWYQPSDVARAAADIAALDNKQDVYVGVALSDRDRGKQRRVDAKQAAGIVGLWLDVDIADDAAHKKSNLPADEAAAKELVAAMGAEPTVVVHSGHGLQAWWLFAEPWIFTTDEDRKAAAALANRWNLTLRIRAAERGLVIDSTFDLARVMRVPGTTNLKDAPVPVRLRSLTARRRYAPSDLEPFLADDGALSMLTGRHTHTVGTLQLSASAQPDFDKLDAALSNDNKFRASWERTRKDMTADSASEYDLSLATLAAAVGWTDQEIANLLIAGRRKHGDDPKLRQDYYGRTIAKARDEVSRAESSEEVDAIREHVEVATATGDERTAQRGRKELLEHLSRLHNVTYTRYVRYGSDPPRYRAETSVGSVTLGGADVILSQPKFKSAIAGATGIVIPRFKGPKWDEIAQAIFAACEDEDVGIESTDEGMAYSWLVEYLQDRPVLDDRDVAATTQVPFRDTAGIVYLFGPPFRKWLWLGRGDRVTAGRMGEVLRAFGCEHQVTNFRIDGQRTTRSVWAVPGLEGLPAPSSNGRRLRAVATDDDSPEAPLGASERSTTAGMGGDGS